MGFSEVSGSADAEIDALVYELDGLMREGDWDSGGEEIEQRCSHCD